MYTLDFSEISLADIPKVGGKNASLGELRKSLKPLGVETVDGFATTVDAYHRLLQVDGLGDKLSEIFFDVDLTNVQELGDVGSYARAAILSTPLPDDLIQAIDDAYDRLCGRLGRSIEVAVRSSATAEDLPGVSFAGQHETYLNVCGKEGLLDSIHKCYASLFTNRAIDYRARNGFDQLQVALSIGVQPMVRSDLASAGVIFTLDTESGCTEVVEITGSYGLGETVVQGQVNPDEWMVFKPTLQKGARSVIGRRLGSKETKLIFSSIGTGTESAQVSEIDRARFCLSDEEVLSLAKWACLVEEHYSRLNGRSQPMDIEWAKDGLTGELFVTQARPETVHAGRKAIGNSKYTLGPTSLEPLLTGQAVGEKIASGPVKIVATSTDLVKVNPGDILVAKTTNPDWEPVMKRVAAIVTDQGGRTSHAAIVSREVGIPCVVGAKVATQVLHDGQIVTVCCAEGSEGRVYADALPFSIEEVAISTLQTKTKVMVNVADPSVAFAIASLPNDGVGLARMEFIINSAIGIHPMALCRYPSLEDDSAVVAIRNQIGSLDPKEFFIQSLSEGIGTIAAAFYPRPVIVRTSDFKTNEYSRLLGGAQFEPDEENPMLGFRGASRYYDQRYADGFALECLALKRVREDMGLTNLKIMIPFCRTVAEAEKVIATMAAHGLVQGENGLEIYGMCEIPSNAISADAFLAVFDGFSIGSNDLTQLALGIDRDAGTISNLFDERDPAVKELIRLAIESAHRCGKPIGICGQAPSDYPEFAQWLVGLGITSISLNPDSVINTIKTIASAEGEREMLGVPGRG